MENYKDDKQEILKALGKGLLISFVMTILILLIFSIILTFTNISEKTIVPVIIISTAISILIGSSISNIRIKKNGILNGALIGGGYILILYLLSSILNARFNLNIQSIIMISVGVVFGILGGIIGVNKR
jgi:putative membrane protein (TIGR04086 family)